MTFYDDPLQQKYKRCHLCDMFLTHLRHFTMVFTYRNCSTKIDNLVHKKMDIPWQKNITNLLTIISSNLQIQNKRY